MAFVKCPNCASEIPDQAAVCPHCGRSGKIAPIRSLGGKLQAIGTILIAVSILAMIAGTWWGAALLFPSAALFMIGRFL
jgi:hypothetical protein